MCLAFGGMREIYDPFKVHIKQPHQWVVIDMPTLIQAGLARDSDIEDPGHHDIEDQAKKKTLYG